MASRTDTCTATGGVYRPRNPRVSHLYQCVIHHYDELEAGGHFTRPVEEQVLTRFIDCGDLHQGFARVYCDNCGHDYLLAFSAIAPALLYLLHPCSRPVKQDTSVRAAIRNACWPTENGWKRMCWPLSLTASMSLPCQSCCGPGFATTAPASAYSASWSPN